MGRRSRAAGALLALLCAGCCSTRAAASLWDTCVWPVYNQLAGRRLQQQQQQQAQTGVSGSRPGAARPAAAAAAARPPGVAQAARSGSSSKPGSSSAASSGTLGLPMCTWNDVKEFCATSHHVYLSLSAPPTTLLHKATAHAYDRNLVCNGQPNEAACVRDKRNRCFFWSKSCVGMDAYELVNWLGAVSQVTGDAALMAFTCPGTQAALYKSCKSASDAGAKGICNALPGCAFVPVVNECLPKALDGKRVADVQALDQAFKAADAAVWGNCEGSCYIRQARVCQAAYNSSSSCTAKPFCVWEYDSFDGRQVCLHRDTASRGSDAFSQELAAVKDRCAKMKTQAECEQPTVSARNAGKLRSMVLPPAAPPNAKVAEKAGFKCSL